MAPTLSIHESHQAELDLQGSAENPPRAAGITVDDDTDMILEVPNGHPPQTTMINPSETALAFNGHPLNSATFQESPFFGAFPHIGYHPAANYSHLTPDIASPWGVVNSEGVIDAMSQPSLQHSNFIGAFDTYVDATNQFVTPVNDVLSNSAPFHADGFDGTSSGFQLPLDMIDTTVSQDVANLNSNSIREVWNLPTNLQPDCSFSGAANELLNFESSNSGALPMSYGPYADPLSNSLNTALTGHNGVCDLSENIFPNTQQPTGFVGPIGDAKLNNDHSIYPAGTAKEPTNLSSSFAPEYEMVSWAAETPLTDMVLRKQEPTTQRCAQLLQAQVQSTADIRDITAPVVCGPERPFQNPSRQVSKRSRKMQAPTSESRSLATQKKREKRKDRQLSRFLSRTRIPQDRIAVFGECARPTVKKRGEGTQKAARERGTCTRCHIHHLRCDSGEGECCNNCQRFWATQATGCTLWRWTRDYWKDLAKEFLSYCRSNSLPMEDLDISEMALQFSNPTWSMLANLLDYLSGHGTFRSLFRHNSGPNVLSMWGYLCRLSQWRHGALVAANHKLQPILGSTMPMFYRLTYMILYAAESLQNAPKGQDALILAYVLSELGSTNYFKTGPFSQWLCEAITTRLKIALSRLTENGSFNSRIPVPVIYTLNESAEGEALLPREHYKLTWSHYPFKAPKIMSRLAHIVCVDPLNHVKECWCGLVFQSVPLDIIRFFGIGDEKDEYRSQFKMFVARHCACMPSLGMMAAREMRINGRWKLSIRLSFGIQLSKVLKSVLQFMNSWQTEKLRLTPEELMIDCEYWQHGIFGETLRITAESFLDTIFEGTIEYISRAYQSQEDVFGDVKLTGFKLMYLRKLKALKTINSTKDDTYFLKMMGVYGIAKQSSGSPTT